MQAAQASVESRRRSRGRRSSPQSSGRNRPPRRPECGVELTTQRVSIEVRGYASSDEQEEEEPTQTGPALRWRRWIRDRRCLLARRGRLRRRRLFARGRLLLLRPRFGRHRDARRRRLDVRNGDARVRFGWRHGDARRGCLDVRAADSEDRSRGRGSDRCGERRGNVVGRSMKTTCIPPDSRRRTRASTVTFTPSRSISMLSREPSSGGSAVTMNMPPNERSRAVAVAAVRLTGCS